MLVHHISPLPHMLLHVRFGRSGETHGITQRRRLGAIVRTPPPRWQQVAPYRRDVASGRPPVRPRLRANRGANGARGLADARGEDVEAFIVELLGKHQPATAKDRYRGLHAFYKWLEDEDEIPHPMRKLKPPAVPEQPVPVIGESQLQRLLAVCAGKDFEARRDTALILLLVDAGPRRSELVGMRLDAVDFEYDVIRVLGKGARERALPFGRKTGVCGQVDGRALVCLPLRDCMLPLRGSYPGARMESRRRDAVMVMPGSSCMPRRRRCGRRLPGGSGPAGGQAVAGGQGVPPGPGDGRGGDCGWPARSAWSRRPSSYRRPGGRCIGRGIGGGLGGRSIRPGVVKAVNARRAAHNLGRTVPPDHPFKRRAVLEVAERSMAAAG